MKAFAGNNLNVIQMLELAFDRVEKSKTCPLGKGFSHV